MTYAGLLTRSANRISTFQHRLCDALPQLCNSSRSPSNPDSDTVLTPLEIQQLSVQVGFDITVRDAFPGVGTNGDHGADRVAAVAIAWAEACLFLLLATTSTVLAALAKNGRRMLQSDVPYKSGLSWAKTSRSFLLWGKSDMTGNQSHSMGTLDSKLGFPESSMVVTEPVHEGEELEPSQLHGEVVVAAAAVERSALEDVLPPPVTDDQAPLGSLEERSGQYTLHL
jgi:hypothetical protein